MKDKVITVIGLGYVGLPLSILFSKKYQTIGFDINTTRISELNTFLDSNNETTTNDLKSFKDSGNSFTSEIDDLRDSNIFIVTVPTPIDDDFKPDMAPLFSACELIGEVLKENDIVIFESTVYPGATEEECIPILERTSNLKFNLDFFVGYSPERINVGDKVHNIDNIIKVTSGSTPTIANFIDNLYKSVLINGTYMAPSIKVAEASKIYENIQRDVLIALSNEFSKICKKLEINMEEVTACASTKWNFSNVSPGLVGGHCIGIDPYYLINKLKVFDYSPELMNTARKINNGMGFYVADEVIRMMNIRGINVFNSKILIMGFTFKENCSDIRNTKVADILTKLNDYSSNLYVYDPRANKEKVKSQYGITLSEKSDLDQGNFDTIILAVAHNEFVGKDISCYLSSSGFIYDLKSILQKDSKCERM